VADEQGMNMPHPNILQTRLPESVIRKSEAAKKDLMKSASQVSKNNKKAQVRRSLN
jgi:hypothetical protein